MSRLGHRPIGSIRWSRFSSRGTSSTVVTCRGARRDDPYAILVSEIMLQQTQVDRVIPRYLAWLERWPTAESLAGGTAADVIRAWQGLGYNRRALALHRAAQLVARDGWPDDLTTLPASARTPRRRSRNFAFGGTCSRTMSTSTGSNDGRAMRSRVPPHRR